MSNGANSSSVRGFVFEGQKDGQSVNSRTSEIRAMQQDFEKRQQDYASKSQQLQQKLKEKYEGNFPTFKARSVTPTQGAVDTESIETTSTNQNRLQDFQQRQADFLQRQYTKKQEMKKEDEMRYNYTPNINSRSKKLAPSPSGELSLQERIYSKTSRLAKKNDCSVNCDH